MSTSTTRTQVHPGALHSPVATVPRLALRREEAAAALGVSADLFDRHIRHELCAVRRGRVALYPVAELEGWLSKNAASTPGAER